MAQVGTSFAASMLCYRLLLSPIDKGGVGCGRILHEVRSHQKIPHTMFGQLRLLGATSVGCRILGVFTMSPNGALRCRGVCNHH